MFELENILNKLNPNKLTVLVVDEVPEIIDRFMDLPYFSCIVVPTGKEYRAQRARYPNFKWVFDTDPDLVADEVSLEIKKLSSKDGLIVRNFRPQESLPWFINYYENADVYTYAQS